MRWLHAEWRHLYGAYDRWVQDDAHLLAAAVAYYVGLAFYPLLLVLIAGVGLLLQNTSFGKNAQEQVLGVLSGQLSPALVDHIQHALAQLKDRTAINGPIGLGATLLTAMAAFAQFDRAFNRIWRVPQPTSEGLLHGVKLVLIDRGIAFLLLLLMGLLVAVISFVSFGIAAIEATTARWMPIPGWVHQGIQTVIPFLLNLLILTLIYRWIPRVNVRLRDAFRGGVVAAVGWEIGRRILASILIGSQYGTEYGVIGSFIAIQLWCYYMVAIVFLGAEYIRDCCPPTPDNTNPLPVK
jgi:membrane protein